MLALRVFLVFVLTVLVVTGAVMAHGAMTQREACAIRLVTCVWDWPKSWE